MKSENIGVDNQSYLQSRNRNINIENKSMDTKREREEMGVG